MICTQGDSKLLVVSKSLVVVVIKELIVEREGAHRLRGKIESKLLECTIVHIVGLRRAAGLNRCSAVTGGTI